MNPSISTIDAIGSSAVLADPYPTYAALRAAGPVHWDEARATWHIVGYGAVLAALRDPRFSSARSNYLLSENQRRDYDALATTLPCMMIFSDPPLHNRLRGLVHTAFSPRKMEGLRSRIHEIVDALLARVAPSGRMDVIADLAIPLPTTVIAELLGVPFSDRDWLKDRSDDFARFIGGPTDAEANRRANDAIRNLTSYFTDALARCRRAPGDDVMSNLDRIKERDQGITDSDLLATCVVLLIGGHETTTNLIGNGMLALLSHPEQLRRLRTDPARLGAAIEELLRFDSPVQLTTRLAASDVALGGAQIARGALVSLWLAAANRDPTQFPGPDLLDFDRADNRHLAFGYGIHFCVGAALARIEAQVAIGTVIQRFPDLELTSELLDYHGTPVFRALKQLPVTL